MRSGEQAVPVACDFLYSKGGLSTCSHNLQWSLLLRSAVQRASRCHTEASSLYAIEDCIASSKLLHDQVSIIPAWFPYWAPAYGHRFPFLAHLQDLLDVATGFDSTSAPPRISKWKPMETPSWGHAVRPYGLTVTAETYLGHCHSCAIKAGRHC